jgi:hypothetical protein
MVSLFVVQLFLNFLNKKCLVVEIIVRSVTMKRGRYFILNPVIVYTRTRKILPIFGLEVRRDRKRE